MTDPDGLYPLTRAALVAPSRTPVGQEGEVAARRAARVLLARARRGVGAARAAAAISTIPTVQRWEGPGRSRLRFPVPPGREPGRSLSSVPLSNPGIAAMSERLCGHRTAVQLGSPTAARAGCPGDPAPRPGRPARRAGRLAAPPPGARLRSPTAAALLAASPAWSKPCRMMAHPDVSWPKPVADGLPRAEWIAAYRQGEGEMDGTDPEPLGKRNSDR